MFGIIPKAIWNRTVPCDDQGRIELAHNCLLLKPVDNRASREPSGSAAGPPRHIVIEVGSGNKFDEKNRRIFGLTDRCIIDALHDVNCRCEEVDHAIVTHLHFDHAGGLTRRPRDGESPDALGAKRTFPNAVVHVQRREWEDALKNRSVMTRTYLPENLEPIRPQLRLLDSPPPFPPAYLPQRNELPPASVSERLTEVLPGIHVFNIPGHTWGSQAVKFTDDQNRTIVFCPDLIPTAGHVGAAYNMAYDVEPYISTVTRRWFLKEAAENHWLLVLDHEPGEPRRRVQADGKGWYELVPANGIGNDAENDQGRE
jgi:glyoxylase-like metal-dependent hydrolase (beta-lactamase superfamily II)